MELNKAYGMALRHVRKQKGLTQEDFEPVTSRAYISRVEGGYHVPTLEKTVELCTRLAVSPSLLLSLCFLIAEDSSSGTDLLAVLKSQLEEIGLPQR
ncbi:helix-turn-helix domain-containing protein [Pseudomonas sp. NPDC087358]|uniref:helix-turn-helix domain-containing protein n=1 Tax=Pseudomonas sp. NPDC087358 TaxID=3364439 RepID=UPI00384ECC66